MIYDKLEKRHDTASSITGEDYLSLAEIGDDEKNWETTHRKSGLNRRTNTWFKTAARYGWLAHLVLVLVNISLSVFLLRDFQQENSSSTMQVGSDFAGTGPDFPTKIVKFNADESFVPKNASEFFSPGVTSRWNTMMPANAGWDTIKTDTFFTTTMTHQLHCVFMMTRIYSTLLTNKLNSLPEDYHSHYLHCVDYLRQGIMCSADLTMEPHGPEDADDNGPLDGSWNGYHVCKDYGHVVPYLEEQIHRGIRQVLPIDD
ncbi:hypothetical protein C7974DRAFT_407591 [Boeremia exigua]|uniref:uncharacterized protein n=1 Tax=Boeremia exigua TaxID=749465 RepID=UPI001E8E9F6C|nr:uncharacterized protein C7974DRAFT_407591 [Boeremia exigua]KAH6643882.1 hypothetical protein C7974DRAFT_407591 [Boeremia exigua]